MTKRDWNERDHPRDENNQKFVKKEFFENSDDDNIHLTKSDYRDTLKKPSVVMLPKREYAEFVSIVRTTYSIKIPKLGRISMYNPIAGYNNYMIFSYDQKEERIVCVKRLDLDKDADVIKALEEAFKNGL